MFANTWRFNVGWSSGVALPLMSPKGMKASCTTASVAFSSSPPAQEGDFDFEIRHHPKVDTITSEPVPMQKLQNSEAWVQGYTFRMLPLHLPIARATHTAATRLLY